MDCLDSPDRAPLGQYLILPKEQIAEEIADIRAERQANKEYLEKLESILDTEKGKALFNAIVNARSTYVDPAE
jgi:hypothetical protein